MPKVKLCGYLTQIDNFNQLHIKFCDPFDDKQNTQYKLGQLKKTGGDNPIKENKFIVKCKGGVHNAYQCNGTTDEPVEAKKLIGSLVEITSEYRRYNFEGKFGWSLHLTMVKNI